MLTKIISNSSFEDVGFIDFLVGKKNQYKLSEEEAVNCVVEFSIKQYAELLGNLTQQAFQRRRMYVVSLKKHCLLNDLSISTAEKRKSEIKRIQRYETD